jgi:hypothetical protein
MNDSSRNKPCWNSVISGIARARASAHTQNHNRCIAKIFIDQIAQNDRINVAASSSNPVYGWFQAWNAWRVNDVSIC